MAARSIANGAYLTLLHIQSGRRRDDWYRIALDRRSLTLSCDCAAWTFNRSGMRACKHTDFAGTLLIGLATPAVTTPMPTTRPAVPATTSTAHAQNAQSAQNVQNAHPYVQAINAQFPGFRGHWQVEERRGLLAGQRYRLVQIRFTGGNSEAVEATVALAESHRLTERERLVEVAVRAGYCIALELAHRRGIDLDVRPPAHFTVRSTGTGGRPDLPQRQSAPPRAAQRTNLPPHHDHIPQELPSIQLDHIMRIAGTPAAGRTPTERAEGTLRLMLGDKAYQRLEFTGYLDVPSALYRERRRVYRLRRDSRKSEDKRVRVFEAVGGEMTYVKDYCIVRANSSLPEADHFLTKWLGLLSDERSIIGVVGPHNIFNPHSDDWGHRIDETIPPVWHEPRGAVVA